MDRLLNMDETLEIHHFKKKWSLHHKSGMNGKLNATRSNSHNNKTR